MFSNTAHIDFPWKTNLFSLQSDSLDFGVVTIGDSSSIGVKIYNRREEAVIINEVFNKDSSFYVDEILPMEISPHDSIEMTIRFEPIEEGRFTDKINFRYVTDTLLIAQQIFIQGETSLTTEIEDLTETLIYSLSQNYPNPFNPSTSIQYQVPTLSSVIIKIYDLLGNEIRTIVSEKKQAGNYEFEFDATGLPSGTYFYRLRAGNFIKTKKMMLMK